MKKYTYYCPVEGCSATATSGAGMSAHLRSAHADIWAGNTQKTIEGLGKETIRVDITENGQIENTEQRPRSSAARKPKPKIKRRRVVKRRKKTRTFDGMPVGYNPSKRDLQRAANSEPEIGSINNCPYCGKKIRHFLLAAGFTQIEARHEKA
jgi:hypothetical protein